AHIADRPCGGPLRPPADRPRGALHLRACREHDHDRTAHEDARPRSFVRRSVHHRLRPRLRNADRARACAHAGSITSDLACGRRLDIGQPDGRDLRTALGGLIYAISPVLIGVICLFFYACSITLITLVKARGPAASRDPPTFASVLAGFHYIRSRRRLLG